MLNRAEVLQVITNEFNAAGISAEELLELYQNNGTFRRMLGLLWSENQESSKFMVAANLISDEGRLNAIQQQGMNLGKMHQLDRLIDLILEGQGNEDTAST